MSSTTAKAVLKPTTIRSMFIRVKPAPRQLSERRAVLRTLQKYGEIEVFQPLLVSLSNPHQPIPSKGVVSLLNKSQEPGSFVSVAAQPATVNNLIDNSPLRFDLVPERSDPTRDIYRLDKTGDSFVLHIFPSTSQHRVQITKAPVYGPWPKEEGSGKSFATSVLEGLVPTDVAGKGMADWETGGQMVRMSDRARPREGELVARVVEERRVRRREREEEKESLEKGGILGGFRE